MDIEVPAAHPTNYSHITRAGQHLLRLETVLFSIYYPTVPNPASHGGRAPDGRARWSRSTWLPRPRRHVAAGYGRFAGMGVAAAVPWFAATTMLTKLPALRNAPLAAHWPPFSSGEEEAGGEKREGPAPPGEEEEEGPPTFPLLVFSHGLGGNRTAYSSVCGEFASYGFVVCALEHRDGSGPRTYVNHPHKEPCVKARSPGWGEEEERRKQEGGRGEGGGRRAEEHGCQTQAPPCGVPESKQEQQETPDSCQPEQQPCKCAVDHTPEQRAAGYDRIDYIFPKDNPIDTSPHASKGVDHELRAAQISLRLAEIEEAYRILRLIVAGRGADVSAANLRTKGYVGASSRGLEGVDWERWKGRFHVEDVTVAGHSFGAATAVEMLRDGQRERFAWCTQGVMYDVWGSAVQPEAEAAATGQKTTKTTDEEEEGEETASQSVGSSTEQKPATTSSASTYTTSTNTAAANAPEDTPTTNSHSISAPLLGINSEAFMYWPSNFSTATALITSAQSSPTPCPAWLLTLRGTVHISQSDFSLLYPRVCSLFLKQTANPRRAMDLNIDASLDFLVRVLPDAHTLGLVRRVLAAADKGERRRLLDAPVVDEVPDVRRPEEKWIGGRLKVRHEFRNRFVPNLARKVKRQKGKMEGSGWDEVWMHVRSGDEVVRGYREGREGRRADVV